MLPRILFTITFLSVFGLTTAFVYRRAVRDAFESKLIRGVLLTLMVGLFVSIPVLRFAFRDSLPPTSLTIAVLFGWGIFLYTFLALVIFEGLKFVRRKRAPSPKPDEPAPVEDPARRVFLARVAATGALAVGSGIATFGAFRAFSPAEVTEVPVPLKGLPKALDGFTIVQLSDIHVGSVIQERFLDQLVSVANGAKPDLVAITGDLVDGSPDLLGRYVARLRNLKSRFGTHFVSGNHDYYSGWDLWAEKLEGIDFVVLRNRYVPIGDLGVSFDLIGVDDWGSRWGTGGYDLDAATRGRDRERASVLMAHQPNGLELASAANIGLQLSGHTHGGQMFPATIIGDAIWGSRNTGLSHHDGTALYTSRGCGFVGPPLRVGAPPEVVKLVLVAT